MTFATGRSDLESRLLPSVGFDDGWAMLERFSTLVRESGSEDEHVAGAYIASELERLGVDHVVYEPELYLSLPRESWIDVGGDRIEAKPPSFAIPTGPDGLEARLVYVPSVKATGQRDLFATGPGSELPDLRGAIVLTDGYAMPAVVSRFEAEGAVGQIYINPGENIHWGICTSIWGTPTTRDLARKPRTPVIAINRPSGERLRALAEGGEASVRIHVALEEGWYPCKLPVARIPGKSDDFMLVHGHYDSWDVGIGDNAVGDATLLELARIFGGGAELERSLWIAWWPGHSTGRYAGSTWFADTFALELRKRCVGAINIDSPGCWHATEYDDVMWMAEAGPLCEAAIQDATGKQAHRLRPLRAGDYSFNQIGLTSFYMLLSNIPAEERAELGFYPTGGCGGNIAWHTEDDVMDVADRDNLERGPRGLRDVDRACARRARTPVRFPGHCGRAGGGPRRLRSGCGGPARSRTGARRAGRAVVGARLSVRLARSERAIVERGRRDQRPVPRAVATARAGRVCGDGSVRARPGAAARADPPPCAGR